MKTKQSPIQISGESTTLRTVRLDCAALTAAGAGRPHNEDSIVFAAPGDPVAEQANAGYLFVVADGETSPGITLSASRETCTSLLEVLDDPRRTDLRPDLMLHRLQDANDRCHDVIKSRCAATALWLWEDTQRAALLAAWAHVGHTRLYHHARGEWKRLTRDHAKGRLLDRAVGQGPGLEIETGQRTILPGERLVLVTAGVWRTSPPGGSISSRSFPTTSEAVRRLVGQARLNGSRDDTTAIVIAVRHGDEDPEPEH
jgi:serine/threonine protein phosphatase PrpC